MWHVENRIGNGLALKVQCPYLGVMLTKNEPNRIMIWSDTKGLMLPFLFQRSHKL